VLDPVAAYTKYRRAALFGSGRGYVPVSVVFFLLPAGLCVIAVGLHRAGILPLWLGLLMPIGVFGVISTLEYPPLLIGFGILLLASFGTVGVRQLRAPNGTVSEAPPI
jgi:hypothetical protein